MSVNKQVQKTSEQLIRAYRLIEVLAGHEFEPLGTNEIARALATTPPQATRHLQAAAKVGWVEKTADGKWRLKAGGISNIATSVQLGIQRAKVGFDEQVHNLTRRVY